MLKFKQLNLNPNGYDTTDCVARVLAYALNISWEEAITIQCDASKKLKYGLDSFEVVEYIFKQYGFKKYHPKRLYYHELEYLESSLDSEFTSNFMSKNIIIFISSGHCNIIDDGYYIDSIDAGNEIVRECYYRAKNA